MVIPSATTTTKESEVIARQVCSETIESVLHPPLSYNVSR